jgi:transmembrane sensor
MDARLAWRAPRIEFSGTPLSDALTLINRYNAVRTVLADPTLGHVRVSGILRADNSENLWRLLEEQHGIRAEHRGETEVVLSRSK